ncbi:hypothetical protein E1A91_A04G136800v1 [Gossypium mustelinum]|uniref:Uncharacterized protein n=1 Tax=Gossypium mustelinum TaxID=34275 RepID=A0A5D2ZRW4_GOSMU|nr:hypothetical protein E1A91_A04G136800v1 [Gossypium mustelinum]
MKGGEFTPFERNNDEKPSDEAVTGQFRRTKGQRGCRWSFWCNGTRGAEPRALDVLTKHVGGYGARGKLGFPGLPKLA